MRSFLALIITFSCAFAFAEKNLYTCFGERTTKFEIKERQIIFVNFWKPFDPKDRMPAQVVDFNKIKDEEKTMLSQWAKESAVKREIENYKAVFAYMDKDPGQEYGLFLINIDEPEASYFSWAIPANRNDEDYSFPLACK
jgi:hypothetical protein